MAFSRERATSLTESEASPSSTSAHRHSQGPSEEGPWRSARETACAMSEKNVERDRPGRLVPVTAAGLGCRDLALDALRLALHAARL